MVERTRYTGRGISLERQAPVDVSNIQETVRASQRLESRLDRISELAFGEAKKDAVRRGQEYAANNRPTLQQYIDAVQAGEDPGKIFAEEGTIAGDEARRLQAAYLKQDLLNELENNLSLFEQQINDDPDVDLDTLSVEINSMIEGMANVLGEGSRDEELSFRATASKIGFDTISKGVEAKKKFDDEVHDAQVLKKQNTFKSNIEGVLKRDRDPISLAGTLLMYEKEHEDFYKRNMDTYAKNMAEFEKLKTATVKSVIADRLIETEMVDEFARGEVTPDLAVLRMLEMDTDEARNEIVEVATDRLVKQFNAAENERKAKRAANQQAEIELHTAYITNQINGTEYLDGRQQLGIPTDEKVIDSVLNNKEPTRGQISRFDTLEAQVIAGEIGPLEITKFAVAGAITPKQESSLKKIWGDQTTKHTDELRVIRGRFSLTDADAADVIKNKKLKYAYTRAVAEYTKEANAARVAKIPFDSQGVAEEVANKYFASFNNAEIDLRIEKNVKPIFNQISRPFNREQFINATDEDIYAITGSDGKPLDRDTYERLIYNRDKIIKYINVGFDILEDEEVK